MPHAFDSSVNRNDIFVFCTSMAKRRDLAREFESDQCVEIIDPLAFASRLAGALRTARPDWTQLQHRPVFYYRDEDPLGTDWAIPTRIATSKRYLYRRQREYRYVCGPPHVFDVHQTSLQLSPPGSIPPQTASVHGEQIVNVGKLGSICRVHTWPAAQPAAAAAEPQMD